MTMALLPFQESLIGGSAFFTIAAQFVNQHFGDTHLDICVQRYLTGIIGTTHFVHVVKRLTFTRNIYHWPGHVVQAQYNIL